MTKKHLRNGERHWQWKGDGWASKICANSLCERGIYQVKTSYRVGSYEAQEDIRDRFMKYFYYHGTTSDTLRTECKACLSASTQGYNSVDKWKMLKDQGGKCVFHRIFNCEDINHDSIHGGSCLAKVDHDPQTGLVRGILCNFCNSRVLPVIERIMDTQELKTIIEYIQMHQK